MNEWTLSGIILLIIIWKLYTLGATLYQHCRRWFKYQYSPNLPDVIQYGGSGNLQAAILTTEYPRDKIVTTTHVDAVRFPYLPRYPLLPEPESILFHALLKALHQQPCYIFMKIPLIDVLITDSQADNSQIATERLQQKQLDFVIYHTVKLKVVGVIMLKDSVDQKLDKHFYQQFINAALSAANIPILQLPVKPRYNITALRQILNKKFKLSII